MEIQKIEPIYIAVDFDGTCTTHEFPKIGKDIGAVPVLRELVANGHKLILFTMRSDMDDVVIPEGSGLYGTSGNYLTDAVNWFKKNNIPLYGIQTNPNQKNWTTSPKCYAQLYIDDAALGCPLIYPEKEKPYVDWIEVRKQLVIKRLIKNVI